MRLKITPISGHVILCKWVLIRAQARKQEPSPRNTPPGSSAPRAAPFPRRFSNGIAAQNSERLRGVTRTCSRLRSRIGDWRGTRAGATGKKMRMRWSMSTELCRAGCVCYFSRTLVCLRVCTRLPTCLRSLILRGRTCAAPPLRLLVFRARLAVRLLHVVHYREAN